MLYIILTEYGIPLNEIYGRVRVGEHMSDVFAAKNVFKKGDALSSLLLNFSLDYAIKRV